MSSSQLKNFIKSKMIDKSLISIFIPTGNRAKSLKKVLESLNKQAYKKFEILIVDYKSTDETPRVINNFKDKLQIKFIRQEKKGLVGAANLALQKTKGEFFIRTDDDVVMKPYWLKAIYETFKKDKKIGGVTGPTVVPKEYLMNRDLFSFENKFKTGNLFWKIVGFIYINYFMEGRPYRVSHWFDSGAFSLGSNYESALKEPVQEINNLEACNWSVRTKLLKQIRGFDCSYGGLGEYHEADAAFRIKKLGYKLIFNPKIFLNHCPSQNGFFNNRPSSYSRMVNFIVFYLRYIKPNSLSKSIKFLSYLLFINCYYIFQTIKHKQLSQLGALAGNIGGLIKYLKLAYNNQ
ncbi:MAG: Glycosyl transferase [Parcubacteria group bacterium GW2011_GWA2_31_28]|nr:MAG: Glycosyl transferase [Parcubacteria group bacterium GW2011_GWA2_31_28]